MTREQFEQALGRYGGDFARWPDALRASAERLAATDKYAAALLSAARKLDATLSESMQPIPVDAAFIGRIVGSLAHGSAHDVTLRPTRRLIAWASAAMMAFLVVGYAAGLAIPSSQSDDAFAGIMFGESWTATDGDTGSML
jgi:hypothetical protein